MLTMTFLGTGCPVPTPLRSGSALMASTEQARVLVDCGSGVATRLVEAGTRGADIDALIITHRHTDHLIDFYQLIVSSWHQGRVKPWIVHAPEPAIQVAKAMVAAWADERAQRIAHEKRPSTAGLEIEWHVLTGVPIRVGDLTIDPFPVDHRPVEPAFGLIFSANGVRVVFSGDTRPCASLAQAAKAAHLLIHEVFVDREMKPTPGLRSPEGVAAVRDYHTVPRDIAALATEAGVGALALTHLVPPNADRRALLDDVFDAGYGGTCIIAEDLMTIELPARVVQWKGLALAF